MLNSIFGQIKSQLAGLADNFLDASGVVKGTLAGETASDMLARWRMHTQLQRTEQSVEDETGIDVEFNNPIDALHSFFKLSEAKLEEITQYDWNVDTKLDTVDGLIKWAAPGDWSLKNFISQATRAGAERFDKNARKT
jgi:hypothetical protein